MWVLDFFQQLLTIRIIYGTKDSVTTYWSFSTNLRHRSDVADSSEFFGHFSTNLRRCSDVVATSQIRQNLLIIFRSICVIAATTQIRQKLLVIFRPVCDIAATSQICQNSVVIFYQSATSLRRCRFVEICWRRMTKIRPHSDVVATSCAHWVESLKF